MASRLEDNLIMIVDTNTVLINSRTILDTTSINSFILYNLGRSTFLGSHFRKTEAMWGYISQGRTSHRGQRQGSEQSESSHMAHSVNPVPTGRFGKNSKTLVE